MGSLKIKWIGQSGYVLSDGKTSICIDPYLSDVVNRIAGRARLVEAPVSPKNLKVDAIICTHNHVDHTDIDAIPNMDTENISFFAPLDCESTLKELGVKKYHKFDVGDKIKVGDFKLKAVFADHTVPAIGVMLQHNGKTLYFSGDTYYNEKLKDIKCDYMFICINGKLGNMNVDEAVRLAKEIQPKVAIPNHYGMFASNTEDPERFTCQIDNGFIMEFNHEYEVRECLI